MQGITLGLILAHGLALYLLIGEPLLGRCTYRALVLAIADKGQARRRYYVLMLLLEWGLVLLVACCAALVGGSATALGLGPIYRAAWVAMSLAILVMVGSLIVIRRLLHDPAELRQALQHVSALLPDTHEERWLYGAVSVTAGFCEELIYRGFLLWYLALVFPMIPQWGGVLLSGIVFGLGHSYQGRWQAVAAGGMGVVLAALYVATGSLLPSIVLHALMDARVLWLLPAEPESA